MLHRMNLSTVTFDVGTGGMRLCQLRSRAGQPRVRDSLKINLTPSGKAADKPAIDARRMLRSIANGDFVGRDVNLILSPPAVSFFPLSLPAAVMKQTPERLESAIKWEVSRGIREPVESLEVRWWKLPHATGQQPNVMVVALPTAVALEFHRQLAAAGLQLRRIDVSPCALARSMRLVMPADVHEVCGILDLGMRQTTLTMVVEGAPVYVRSLPITGPVWTRMVSDALKIGGDMAESIKRRVGIVPGSSAAHHADTTTDLSDEMLPGVLFRLLREPLEALVQEILDCFSYVFRSHSDYHTGRLWLAGGGANLAGLPEYLEMTCGMSVARLAHQPCEGESQESNGGCFDVDTAICVGGALLDAEAA